MTDYPTICIKCAERFRDRALLMAETGLGLAVGETATHTIQGFKRTANGRQETQFHVKRTKTGVTVRQIEGRAV